MSFSTDIDQHYRALVQDPFQFLSSLYIEDEKGALSRFGNPHNEQIMMLDDMMSDRELLVYITPRQIGKTTIACGWNYIYGYASLDPVRTLTVAHEAEATDAIFRKIRTFHDNLPATLKRPVERSNKKELKYADTGAVWRCMTAGGRSHGRAWTYQRLHADEIAFWPHAAEVWASVTSTIHQGPHRQIIVTSTPNGPGGIFHDMVKRGQSDPKVLLRFFKWSDHSSYRADPPKGWEPDQSEADLSKLHGWDLHQVYWRHQKIHGVEGIGIEQFRREYPATIEEGFLTFSGSWYDIEYLNELLAVLYEPKQHLEFRVFEEVEPGMTYAIGADPSWGTGGDYAVAQVVSADHRQVAVIETNTRSPDEFALAVGRLSALYNNARVLCEANTGGSGPVVIKNLMSMGVPLWKNEKGEDFKTWSLGGRLGGSKGMVYAHARDIVNADGVQLNDFGTVQQCCYVRLVGGKLEGQNGYNDDLSDALALALWNLRTVRAPSMAPPITWKRRVTHRATPFG